MRASSSPRTQICPEAGVSVRQFSSGQEAPPEKRTPSWASCLFSRWPPRAGLFWDGPPCLQATTFPCVGVSWPSVRQGVGLDSDALSNYILRLFGQ